jgi:predicted DNA binding CopG/RHH family protein
MRKEYDFSKSIKNPYINRLKKQITIRIDEDTIDYFKKLADGTGIPYQKLMNMYLSDCAKNNKKIHINWK